MRKITIVGLGSGDISNISLGAYNTVKNAKNLFLRTSVHPIVQELKNVEFSTFDYLYESKQNFEEIYSSIVDILIKEVLEKNDIVYAVLGHPRVAETSVDLILKDERISEFGIEIEILSSNSFIDDMFVFLNVDPTTNGFLILDAMSFDRKNLFSTSDMVFTQVYDKFVASELKIQLLEYYSEDAEVILFKGAGVKDIEHKISLKLYELDMLGFEFDHLTSIYIPYKKDRLKYKTLFDLEATMEILRGENGCPWDKKQNYESLIPHLREELEELIVAIQKYDIDNMVEELGDVLMLLVMEAQFGKEDEYFNILEVVHKVTEKMIFRHPYVFSKEENVTVDEANLIWEIQKSKEK